MSIHQLIVALIMCRQKQPKEGFCSTISEKIYRILQLICFEMEPNQIQRSEVEYIFHLICQWVEVTTMYKITDTLVIKKICNNLYNDSETVSLREVTNLMAIQPETIALFEIFAKSKP